MRSMQRPRNPKVASPAPSNPGRPGGAGRTGAAARAAASAGGKVSFSHDPSLTASQAAPA